jgi:AcrR family transcriptional regulator
MKQEAAMPRRMPTDRIEQLVSAATDVFIERGYAKTQIADVAEALGVAKGTIYLCVESKEALFDLALRFADAPTPYRGVPALPVPTPRPGSTLRFVRGRLAAEGLPSALVARRLGRASDPGAELAGIVRELYDALARNRRTMKLVDRSARDYPELAGLWFVGARGGAIDRLARYLAARIRRGELRPVPDPLVAARLILETIVFWAVHRHWDAHPQTVGEELARETVVRFVVGALAPLEPEKERPR